MGWALEKGVVLGLFLEPAGLPHGFLVDGFGRARFSRGWFVAGDGGQRERWKEELVLLSQEDVKSKSKERELWKMEITMELLVIMTKRVMKREVAQNVMGVWNVSRGMK